MTTRIQNTLAIAGITGLMAGCCTPPIPPPMAGGPPVIIHQPISQIKERGTHVDFTVIVTNIGSDVTYQWRKDGSNILAATNKTYCIEAVQVTNVASYTCEITGSLTTNSDPAHLSVFYTYCTNSVAGTLVAPIGAFSVANPAITIEGVNFNRVSSNYFYFYGPNAVPQTGDFRNTTYMPTLTLDTYHPDNNAVDTAIKVWEDFKWWGTFQDNDTPQSPPASPPQPKLSKVGPITLSTDSDPAKSAYRVTVYYKNATIGSNTTITFNWLYE